MSQPSSPCPVCRTASDPAILAQAHWYPFWDRADGGCPACVQQRLLQTLLERGDPAFHESVQRSWPLDAEAAFGAIPTPLRLHADPRYSGRGVTLAMVDSGFYPHSDLVEPRNRIRAWVDATVEPARVIRFGEGEPPRWPGWDQLASSQWHGTMTSVVAAGNGFLSHGLYRGLASEAGLVLVQVRDREGHITNASIERAFRWLLEHASSLGLLVVSASVSGDPVEPLAGNPVDEAALALVAAGITVVAAAGNDGIRRLVPPATAPLLLTVGGIDDRNSFDHAAVELWHSNYGEGGDGASKPELVAPSLWVVAPILPGTPVAVEAAELFSRPGHDGRRRERVGELKLVTPHYQHVEGTSFAAPVVAGTVACMVEARPRLGPGGVRDALLATAHRVAGAPIERQGAGVLCAGQAVARALSESHAARPWPYSPRPESEGTRFALHDHRASRVRVWGSWNGWADAVDAATVEPGWWESPPVPLPPGRYAYKFLLDEATWLADPANPRRIHDGQGGFNSLLLVH